MMIFENVVILLVEPFFRPGVFVVAMLLIDKMPLQSYGCTFEADF